MSPWRKFLLSNYFVGVLKYPFLLLGRHIFGYSRWNARPINRKPYALHIIETVERLIEDGQIRNGYIVEVGCGMGDIIGNIKYDKKIGVDIDEHVIRAAKICHRNTEFYTGGWTLSRFAILMC